MNKNDGFYTQTAYTGETTISAAMEDYLEMICRRARAGEEIRVRDLAADLHVRPSSVTHMVRALAVAGYLTAERYGRIRPTEAGRAMGDYLLWRHETVHRFLCALNRSASELSTCEQIEHYLDRRTVENMQTLTRLLTEGK